MNINRSSRFREEWSVEVEHGGYYQLPHDFIRNLRALDLSPIQTLIIIHLLGYGSRQQVPAKKIAKELNISEKSVRIAFQVLSKRRLMHRNFGSHGEANTFTFGGLKRLVGELAKDRQRSTNNLHGGIGSEFPKHKQNLGTNKELNKKIYKEHGEGYASFKRMQAELRNKRKDKL